MELRFRGESNGDPWSGLQQNICIDTAGYVFVLNKKAPLETKTFLLQQLLNNKLKISSLSASDDPEFDDDLTLLVSCELSTLQTFAKHVYMPQQLRRQNVNEKSESLARGEKERILLFVLENAIIQKERSTLVGYDNVTIYPGQSIGNYGKCIFINLILFSNKKSVQICHREQVILNYFPLHQADSLNQLKSNLCSSFVNDIGLSNLVYLTILFNLLFV